ncbi:MAG: hypothetical protein K0R84_2875 [Clostridia bacterium]|nr:hypothetical protein [Clostridia bacterium]
MSKRVAFGGIMTALCVMLVYFAAYLPTGRLGIYVLSSLVIASAVIELGARWGAVVYAASSALIFLLTGSISAFLLFTIFFGSYPLLKYYIEKVRSAAAEIVLKLAAFNMLSIAAYYIFKALMGVSPIALPELSAWILAGIAAAVQLAFLFYDYIFSRLIAYYMDRIRIIRS